jgi:hypothetical protein
VTNVRSGELSVCVCLRSYFEKESSYKMAKLIFPLDMMAIAYASKMMRPQKKAVGQVHDYITNANCKSSYITYSKSACLKDGQCYPLGTPNDCLKGHNDCKSGWDDNVCGVTLLHSC